MSRQEACVLQVLEHTEFLLPAFFGSCVLQKLVLSENSLSGALPPSWSAMAGLAELWLEFNNVSTNDLAARRSMLCTVAAMFQTVP